MAKKDLSSMSARSAGLAPRNPGGGDRFLMADGELETPESTAGQGGDLSKEGLQGSPTPIMPVGEPLRPRPTRSAAQVAASLDRLLPSRFTPGADQVYGMVAIALDPKTRQELAAQTGDRDNSAFVREALAWAADKAPSDIVQRAADVDNGRRLSHGFARAITCRMVSRDLEVLDALGQRCGLKRKPALEGCVALYLAHRRG